MPEWPEMEHYRRMLEPQMAHRRITEVEIGREKSINVPVSEFRQAVQGQVILSVERIAKQLIFCLENGYRLVLHLMLGGWMYFGEEQSRPQRTIQVKLAIGSNALYCINLRLGHMHLLTEEQLSELASRYGPDPFAPICTAERLQHTLGKKRTSLKIALVDQSLIAGIGNCYADEICHDAQIRPDRTCATLSLDEWEKLLRSMKRILSEALRWGGYMEYPLFVDDTITGGYDERCAVYDRQDEPCPRCGHHIQLETLRSRKTYYCMNCQR